MRFVFLFRYLFDFLVFNFFFFCLLQRSFKKDFFDEVANRIERSRIRSNEEIEKFRTLLEDAYKIYGKNLSCIYMCV